MGVDVFKFEDLQEHINSYILIPIRVNQSDRSITIQYKVILHGQKLYCMAKKLYGMVFPSASARGCMCMLWPCSGRDNSVTVSAVWIVVCEVE